MKYLSAISAAVALAASTLNAAVDTTDRVLLTYGLGATEEAQFSPTDGRLSAFWGYWPVLDRIAEHPPANCYPDRCGFSGAADAGLEVRAAASSEYLYLCFTVSDDRWVARSTADDWGADVIDFYLDTQPSSTLRSCTDCLIGLYGSYLSYCTQMFQLWIGDSTLSNGFRVSYYDPNLWSWVTMAYSWERAYAELGVRAEVVVLDPTHRALELRIPWSRMGSACGLAATPAQGARLGFAAGYNDKDGDNVNADCLRWFGKDPWSSDSCYWGDLEIAPGSAASGITVTAPAANARWVKGTTRTITWAAGITVSAIKIDLSLDGGATWASVEPYTANDGSYSWVVPDTLSTRCKLRLSDATDGDPFGESGVFSIVAPYVTITAPNGGESWTVGTAQTIRWTWEGQVGPVAIDLSTDNAATWTAIVASTANSGQYAWTVPNAVSARCRVRVHEAGKAAPSDTSNAAFAIVVPAVGVQYPNGGEDIVVDSTVNVRWQSAGVSGNVKIDISLDDGQSWNTLVASTANDASEPCRMPATASATCRIRVSDALDGVPSDVSDRAFRLSAESAALSSPNGGEQWLVGASQTVTWWIRGSVANVKLDISTDNCTTWTTLLASTPNDGSQAITVPATVSAACCVRVSDAADGWPSDISNAVFTILATGLRLTAPNGGEVWRPGTFHNITWATVGSIAQVKLEYSTNSGTTWKVILASMGNGGSYNWTVPSDISRTCRMRVSDAADGAPFDVSDSLFAIDNVSAVLAGRVPARTGLLGFGPNPARGVLGVQFGLAAATRVAITVHRMDGRLVASLGDCVRPAGSYALNWDCTSEGGSPVQAGTYVVSLRLGDQVQRRVVTVAR